METIVRRIPAPSGDENAPTKALIYDSWFDNYLGALGLVRVYEGKITKGPEGFRIYGYQRKRHPGLGGFIVIPQPYFPN